MKRSILCFAASLLAMGATAQNSAVYKAQDLIQKNEITQAEQVLEAAIANPKTTKYAQIYQLAGTVQQRIFNPQLLRAAQSQPFDTLAFCTHLDKAVEYFTKSEEANNAPDAKGRVKPDSKISFMNKQYITQMLDYYNYAGMFMNAAGNKEKSVEYFQKYAELPKNVVYTQDETDSIYAAKKLNYQQTRLNLAYLAYQSKQWDKAIAACDEALKDTMGTHDLYVIKIQALGEKKDSLAWQNTLAEAAQRTGSQNFSQTLLYYYMQNNKIADAEALAQRMVTESPDNKASWFMKGAIELNVKKDYPASRESFKKALAIDADYQEALYNMGTAYLNEVFDLSHSGKFKYIGTNRAITGKKSDGSFQRNNAIYEKELATVRQYYKDAQPYFEHLRELKPDNPRLWASPLQNIYSSLGMKEKADEMDKIQEEANKAALAK